MLAERFPKPTQEVSPRLASRRQANRPDLYDMRLGDSVCCALIYDESASGLSELSGVCLPGIHDNGRTAGRLPALVGGSG